jgi:CBS domain containing-hemolysin-like protein
MAVVEIHLVRLESQSAIGARDAPKVTQQLDHPGLANPNALQLEITISSVILDVVGSLARASCHDPKSHNSSVSEYQIGRFRP